MSADVLIIDNYDSFTYNLHQSFGALGAEPLVVKNDAISIDEIRGRKPSHIVLSPGPGSPDRERDFGVCSRVILELAEEIPVLGVCLGHQGIVHFLGGRIVRAPQIKHGKTSRIRVEPRGLFAGLGPEIEVMRYHSLLGERASMPAVLRISGETVDDGLVMAVEHTSWPLYGIQFHPESIGTPAGLQILRNFLEVRAA